VIWGRLRRACLELEVIWIFLPVIRAIDASKGRQVNSLGHKAGQDNHYLGIVGGTIDTVPAQNRLREMDQIHHSTTTIRNGPTAIPFSVWSEGPVTDASGWEYCLSFDAKLTKGQKP